MLCLQILASFNFNSIAWNCCSRIFILFLALTLSLSPFLSNLNHHEIVIRKPESVAGQWKNFLLIILLIINTNQPTTISYRSSTKIFIQISIKNLIIYNQLYLSLFRNRRKKIKIVPPVETAMLIMFQTMKWKLNETQAKLINDINELMNYVLGCLAKNKLSGSTAKFIQKNNQNQKMREKKLPDPIRQTKFGALMDQNTNTKKNSSKLNYWTKIVCNVFPAIIPKKT